MRKKFSKFIALTTVLTVVGSGIVGCSEKKVEETKVAETTVEETTVSNVDIYNQYVKDTLIEKYGVADLSEFEATITPNDDYTEYASNRNINLEGIASAYIDDMNADGVEDLMIIRYDVAEESEEYGKVFQMKMAAYTIEDGQVKMLDEIELGAHHGGSEERYEQARVTTAERETSDKQIYVEAITDGENKYIMLDVTNFMWTFGDGIYQYKTVYKLNGDKLEPAFAFEQDGAGSAMFSYTGYVGEEATLLYSEDEGEKGKYETYEEALVSFFADMGIKVVQKQESRSVVTDESLVNIIYAYEWAASESDGKKAFYAQTAASYTNVGSMAEALSKSDKS